MTKTTIEWADEVWNPVTGCSKVSEGCRHCYAERVAGRFWGERKFTDVRVHPERLEDPLHWRKPRRVFVNSMSDLFHHDVPFHFVYRVWRTAALANQHTFMILTKRPDRMLEFSHWMAGGDDISVAEWPQNVWLGVSVETQKEADKRVPLLLETPAAVRFVSCEPLLGPVRLGEWLPSYDPTQHYARPEHEGKLDWVIAGGESGPGARPCHPDWARGLRDACLASNVPFFFKQWGEWLPISEMGEEEQDHLYEPALERYPDSTRECKVPCRAIGFDGGEHWHLTNGFPSFLTFQVGKKRAGRDLNGRTWEEFPR